MDVFKPYALSTSSYLALQSLPLLLAPSLLTTLCTPDPRRVTDLETYLARALALSLLTLSIQTLLLTDIIPLRGNESTEALSTDPAAKDQRKNPYAKPTLIVTTTYHALSAFYLYTRLLQGWNVAFTSGLVVSSGLFCLGMWVILFGGEAARLSKTTGADKRTGNFPFENKESAREKKKEEREREGKGKRRSMLRSGSFR